MSWDVLAASSAAAMTYPTYPVVGAAGTRSAAPKPALHCIACSLHNFDYRTEQGPRQLTGCLHSLDWPFCFLSGSPLHLSHDLLDCLLGRLTAVFWRYIGIWANVLMPCSHVSNSNFHIGIVLESSLEASLPGKPLSALQKAF